MSLLKEIEAHATAAWSPLSARSNLLAIGSKDGVGVGFDNYGGELQIHSMDFCDVSPQTTNLGTVKTSARFVSIAWAAPAKLAEECPYGIIAGGMSDGTVNIFDPSKIIAGDTDGALVCSIQRHKGGVNALHFNPHHESSHLLASGGSDGEVLIMSLEKLSAPGVFTPTGQSLTGANGEVTAVAWNSQVSHILATGFHNGATTIWDLKQKKPWCELRDPSRSPVAAICWNPNEGLHIMTASGDDQRHSMCLWDLRTSTSTPLVELKDHSAGILSVSWCPNDPGLVLSCGKDNRTLLWDLFSGKSIYELPSNTPTIANQGNSGQFFSGAGGGQRRFKIEWSPKIPAIATACTFDGKVQVYGLSGAGVNGSRAPKWFRRPSTAGFGFGGKLVTVNNPVVANPHVKPRVSLHRIVTEPQVVQDAEQFEAALSQRDFKQYCVNKVAQASSAHERDVWTFMQILFEDDARQQLLLHLGFDSDEIKASAAKYAGKPLGGASDEPQQSTEDSVLTGNGGFDLIGGGVASGQSADDVFGMDAAVDSLASESSALSLAGASSESGPSEDTSDRIDSGLTPVYTAESERIKKSCLIVGNFEGAVDCCLRNNQLAEALLLASCGGPELWTRTQEAFFRHQNLASMHVISAIMKSELSVLIEQADLVNWKETLAILSTYGKSEEFPALCEKLAARLYDADMHEPATLCYMCAVNVERTVHIWVLAAQQEFRVRGKTASLQRLVEKVMIFSQALNPPGQNMGEEVAAQFAEYASLIAAEGRPDIAQRFLIFPDKSCEIMRYRLYQANPMHGVQPPAFPFGDAPSISANTANAVPQQQTTAPVAQKQQHSTQQNQYQQHAGQGFNQPSTPGNFNQGANMGYGAAPTQYGQQQIPQAGVYGAPQPVPNSYSNQAPQKASYPGQSQPQTPSYPGQQPQTPSYPGQSQPQTPSYPGQSQPPQPSFPTPSQPSVSHAAYPAPQTPSYGVGVPSPQSGFGMPSSSPQPGFASQNSAYAAQQATPGVNSVAAAQNQPKIVKNAPVDMSKHRSDGFVSSVGNRELSMKYGNMTPMSPQSNAPAAPQQPAKPAAPLGCTDSVPQENMPIVDAFKALVQQLETAQLLSSERRQLAEGSKAKDILFSKLNASDLPDRVVEKLHDMVQHINGRNFRAALQIHVGLTTSDWAEQKNWLKGVKLLLNVSLKRLSS